MTAEEQAMTIMAKFITGTIGLPTLSNKQAKQCSMIAVSEIIKIVPYISNDKTKADTVEELRADDTSFVSYWEEVKQELKKL